MLVYKQKIAIVILLFLKVLNHWVFNVLLEFSVILLIEALCITSAERVLWYGLTEKFHGIKPGVSNLFANGPQSLMWTDSFATHVKFKLSGTHYCLN
jgi:hypothetical protein